MNMNWNYFIAILAFVVLVNAGPTTENNTPGYSPIGKRDPFKAPTSMVSREIASTNPIERYSLDKFQLKAILRDQGVAHAMLQSPDNKTFIVSEGDKVGREKATLSRILNTELILTEKTTNYLGKESLYERVLSLPTEETINSAAGNSGDASQGVQIGAVNHSDSARSAASVPAPAPRAAPPGAASGSSSPPPFIGPNVK